LQILGVVCGMSRGWGGRILRHGSCGRSRLLDTQTGVVTEEGEVGKTPAVTSKILSYFLCLDFMDVYWLYFCVLFLIVCFFTLVHKSSSKWRRSTPLQVQWRPHEVLAHPPQISTGLFCEVSYAPKPLLFLLIGTLAVTTKGETLTPILVPSFRSHVPGTKLPPFNT